MKWEELIMLEVSGKHREDIQKKIVSLISKIDRDDGLESASLYRHAMTENGLIIHINWDSEHVEHWGSPTGHSLCNVLKTFGPVSHAVWIEVEQVSGHPLHAPRTPLHRGVADGNGVM